MQSGLLHLFLPSNVLCGFLLFDSGNEALMRKLLTFGCLQKAVSGGLGNTSFRCWFWPSIDRQCLACTLKIEGSLGSYVTAKTGLLVCFCLFVSLRAANLGIFLTLSRAESTKLSEYPLSRSCDFISSRLWIKLE